jgi:hypothetical protein
VFFKLDSFHIVLGVLGCAGLLAFLLLYDEASPVASVNLKLPRDEIASIAKAFLEAKGHDLSGYHTVTVFQVENERSFYLERTLGMAEANRFMRNVLPIRYWYFRAFKPLQKEEYRVWVEPTGSILAYNHIVSEGTPGANLSQDEAYKIAERFLTEEVGIGLDDWTMGRPVTIELAYRTDHQFTWFNKSFAVDGANILLRVGLQGDEISNFNLGILRIPERFSRRFDRERSWARMLYDSSYFLAVILFFCAFFSMIWMYKHRVLPIKGFLLLGAAVLALSIAHTVNMFPVFKAYYPTSQRMITYLLGRVGDEMTDNLIYNLFVILVVGLAGYAVAKEVSRGEDRIINFKGDRWIGLSISSARGVSVAFIHLGYLVCFYMAARRFGAWVPLREFYTDLYGTKLPFLYPLLVGAGASVNEEFLYRLFGISFFMWITKRRWLALLIPAVIWGFLHSGYLRAPVYLRGIELSLMGLFYGYLFVRFDVMTVIMAHYTYNAILTGVPLVRSDSLYFIASGIIVMAPGLMLALLGLFRISIQRMTGKRPKPSSSEIIVLEGKGFLENDVIWEEMAELPLRGSLKEGCRPEDICGFIARREGKQVGYAVVVFQPDLELNEPVGRIVRFSADDKTIASELCRRLTSHTLNKAVRAITVSIRTKDTKEKQFWIDEGYVPEKDILYKHLKRDEAN